MQTHIHKELQVYWFPSQAAFLQWLNRNESQLESIWLQMAKKASQHTSLSYEEAREAAIIYGWIDGLLNRLDDDFYLIKFSQRRPKSQWSQINRAIAQELIQTGKMKPSGLQQVEAAKKDGRWQAAYPSSRNIQVPAELQQRLDQNPKAMAFFESISKTNRYAFLHRIINAKRPETKARHIDKTMAMLEAEQVYHPKIRKQK